MKAVNDKIIVSCDPNQKSVFLVGGNEVRMPLNYEKNYRIKSPVIAVVAQGNLYVSEGEVLLCHHNLFYLPSPYHLYENLFSIPFSKILFAKVGLDGGLTPICGNILGYKVDVESTIPLPPDDRAQYNNRIVVEKSSVPQFHKGQLLFTRPFAPYDIVYNFNGEPKTITKVSDDMVCGIANPATDSH